ncbi:MAG: NADH-quinone oxidoreductase subunit NuoH [Chloroflexota bacterium]|nr:NADH-quinone oxidoreductase subunit NuoH [Chloroflexota bacterium]
MWDFVQNLFPNLGALLQQGLTASLPAWLAYLAIGLINIVVVVGFVVTMVMVLTYMERKVVGRFQIRYGPNRVGPVGILQPVADAVKLLLKEDIVPASADRWVHWLAPVVVFVPTLMFFAVIPFQKGAIIADLNIGILYIIAIGSMGVIGIFMAGWASNNKYSLVGALRGIAQLVSYEVPMVLSVIGVVMVAGSLSMVKIVEAQGIPFILLQPIGFLIYFIAASAELNRSPMDLLEAESEIVAGYHTEYSGMKWALFFLAEYGNGLAVAAIATTLFLGGWKGPILPPYLWFLIKVLAVFFLFLWTRATLPRLRVDQLMGLAWKFLFPLALLNILITGLEITFWSQVPDVLLVLVNIALAAALIVLLARLFAPRGEKVVS